MWRTTFDDRMDGLLGRIPPAVDPAGPNLHWAVRVTYAATFLAHGLPTFLDAGPTSFAATLGASGRPASLVAGLAVVAGALVLAGGTGRAWATRLAGLAAAPVTLGLVAVQWPRWSFVATEARPLGGMEFPALLLALSLLFAVQGNRWGQG